ncbi:large conductance mechanosensitive channel protein MscL [Paucihalobacter ruber]|uniref:Large-conductance mechanosensitive channel n=1 Tax=Paucihalobacter ruber TaxID=2567861 RepID=A0A506PFN9_9FLAO|nr:large conductance mechanosensitive channel protein MscL [Paucihalobacter ruber]TPV32419.1 large conductance mechanosensitive channel protein MscL [Paucihalobacter ruber]
MKFLKEFKEFAVKGNMIDIAVGVIIGASFNKVIDVLVKQIMMPPLSMLTNGINYSEKKYILQKEVLDARGEEITQEIAIGYGLFLETLLDFFIVGMTVFIVVKGMNRFKRRAQDAKDKTVETPKDIELLSKMSDLLEEQNAILKQTK